MSISNLKVFNVSTANKQPNSSDTDNFNYYFEIKSPDDFTHVSIISINLPKSWYVIRSPLNIFILEENSTQISIIFPEGNYSNFDLFTQFQLLLNTNSPNGYLYQVLEVNSLSIGTNPVPDEFKIQVSNNAPPGSNIYFIFPYNSIVNSVLGYNDGVNNQLPGVVNVAPLLYNLNYESVVYLISDIVNSDFNDNNFSNQTLAVINAADVPYGSYINKSYDIITNKKRFSARGKIFNFQLVTDNQLPSFFTNNINMQFQIAFFTYTPNINYYSKSILIQEFNALK